MENRLTLLIILFFGLVSCTVFGYNITSFTNGYDAENLTFTSLDSYTRTVKVPLTANITNATIQITGKPHSNNTYKYLTYYHNYTCGLGAACANRYDNISTTTGTYNPCVSGIGYTNETYLIPSIFNKTNANYTYIFHTFNYFKAKRVPQNCSNYSSYINLEIVFYCIGPTTYANITCQEQSGNKQTFFNSAADDDLTGVMSIYSTFMSMETNYPTNPYLDISDDVPNYMWQYNNSYNITSTVDFTSPLRAYKNIGCDYTDDTYCYMNLYFGQREKIDFDGYTDSWLGEGTTIQYSTLEYGLLNITYELQYNITLIDERTRLPLDINLVDVARVFESNNLYDLKSSSSNNIQLNFTSNNKFRLELNIGDGSIITKYFDISLLSNNSLRICANPENSTHYEQVILSVSETSKAKLYNSYADCWVVADYTRFGYQTQNSLKAYTIESDYVLYVSNNNTFTELIGLDGTVTSSINIDTILFSQKQYNTAINGESLNINRLYPTNTTMQISYKNYREDNTAVKLEIYNMYTNTLTYSSTSFADINNITIYYDFALESYNNETIWKVELTKTTARGTNTITKYFNAKTQSGGMRSEVALTFAIIIFIFAMTTLVPQFSLGWFGIIACLIGIILLATAVPAWYTYYMMGMLSIILIFNLIILTVQKPQTVAT